jgi:asparagine synthase (glutamine-hydrolysing)
MSAQFGRWNFAGGLLEPEEVARVAALLAPYGPDRCDSYLRDGISLVQCALHTTEESRSEIQPHISASGTILIWDGRLDNRGELAHELALRTTGDISDLSVVASAYERWGNESFRRLQGDWALALCRPQDHSLILAKDFLGTRSLYFSIANNQFTWSSVLEPLLLFHRGALQMNEEYVAGWLASFPAVTMTPYLGIHAVPPACCILLRDGRTTTSQYWDFDPDKSVRLATDRDYEEHFRELFAQSLRRRLRSHVPVAAELSGGMDSSSIVCMAHHIRNAKHSERPSLITVSYYDDFEPHWNERPYFECVERFLGRAGCHINFGSHGSFTHTGNERFPAAPPSGLLPAACAKQLASCLSAYGSRVILSGFGGDEVLGGVPTPLPELADHFAKVRLLQLSRQMTAWAMAGRKPLLHLAGELAQLFLPVALVRPRKSARPASWIQPSFLRRHSEAFRNYATRMKFFGKRPSFQEALSTLNVLQRQIATLSLPSEPAYERRFPYLDRDLLEFLYAIPREQLVRPGERRSLMRRAMTGIVPSEILHRKRKAFVMRKPLAQIAAEWPAFAERTAHMASASLGIVDPDEFHEALRMARDGREVPIGFLVRTLLMESWLARQVSSGLEMPNSTRLHSDGRPREFGKESPPCRVA